MHAPYRIATPPEPIRTEEADSYEKNLVAERTRERLIGVGMAVAGIAVATIAVTTLSNLSHRDRHIVEAQARVDARIAAAKTVIADAERAADDAQDAFQTAVLYEMREGAPAASAPCNVEIAPRRNAFPLLVASGPTDEDLQSPSVAQLSTDVHRAEELMNTGHPSEAILYADALANTPPSIRLTRDVVLVPTKRVPPSRTSPTSFTPGVIEGTAYLYDFRLKAVICKGEIHAESSRAIQYSYNDGTFALPKDWESQAPRLDATLDDDLDAQLFRAIAAPGVLHAIIR